MKKQMYGVVGGFLLAFSVMPAISVQAANEITVDIAVPADAETKIAPGRNFYVTGSLGTPEGAPLADSLRVTVTEEGGTQPARIVEVDKDSLALDANYSALKYYSPTTIEDIQASRMPDLAYDTEIEGSFNDPQKKGFFDDTQYSALIVGGVDENTIKDNAPYNTEAVSPLSEGNYTILVEVKDEAGTVIGSASKQMTVGITQNRLMSRFSPSNHMENVKALAAENGWRVYNDPFPGYWSFAGADGSSKFAEILPQWRAANMQEYVDGMTHLVVYNVSATSATYSVELATLQSLKHVNDDYLACYYYQYGEPALANGTTSDFQAFAAGDKLQLTRAEIGVANSKDNYYAEEDSKNAEMDLNVSDGVAAEAGEVISLYGVTAPIQVGEGDIVFDSTMNVYTINNKTSKIKYHITDGAGIDTTVEKEVKLERGKYGSEFEFKHDIPVTEEMKGKKLTVLVSGYDKYDTLVAGTEEKFEIAVGGAVPAPTPTPEPKPEPKPAPDVQTPQDKGSGQTKQAEKLNVPKTGDKENTAGLMIALLLSGTAITASVYGKKKLSYK